MALRRILLRIMLGALALAALGAITGILTSAWGEIWQIVWTSIAAAVAVTFMLGFSRAMDHEERAAGGLMGMGWSVIGFLLALAFIWTWDRWHWTQHYESLAFTLLYWGLCGLPAVAIGYRLRPKKSQPAVWSGIAIAGVIFLMLVFAAWWDEYPLRNHLTSTAGLLALFGVVGLLNAAALDGRRLLWLRIVGMAAAFLAFVMATAGVWLETDSKFGFRVVWGLGSAALFAGLVALCMRFSLSMMQSWIRTSTLLVSCGTLVAVNILVVRDSDVGDVLGRLATVGGIVSMCGLLALVIFDRLNRRERSFVASEEEAIMVSATCPRCGKTEHLPVNGAACSACHLKINIRVEEPRCVTCGYLLFMLRSPRCPECGTEIAGAALAAEPPATGLMR